MRPPENRTTPPASMAAVATRFDAIDANLAALTRQQNSANGELYRLLEDMRDQIKALGDSGREATRETARRLADHEERIETLEGGVTSNGHA